MSYNETGFSYDSLTQMWEQTLDKLVRDGKQVGTRNGGSREFMNWNGTLTDIEQNFVLNDWRAADPSYAAAELLWYASSQSNVKMLLSYAPSYIRFAEADGCAHGAYGPRIMPLLENVIQTLRRHPDTRQAVLPFWKPTDVKFTHQVNDMPCTVALHFILRDNRLHCICYMRSNDVWLGMPYDVFAFTMIQRLIADELKVTYGEYHHHVGSMHLYDTNFENGKKALSTQPYGDELSMWDKRFRLDELNNAVLVEEEIRVRNKIYDLRPSESTANDMLICCVNKLKGLELPTQSSILNLAFEIKRRKSGL